MPTLHDFTAKTIDGKDRALADYRGKVLLVVNVASECGFTPHYTGMEALQKKYGGRGFAVLGFPCNQFGAQEPGDDATIAKFCETAYGVTFPMFAKIEVNGDHTHPLYQHLKASAPGLLGTEAIKWNFTKFLVGKDGETIRRYAPKVDPADIAGDVEAALQK